MQETPTGGAVLPAAAAAKQVEELPALGSSSSMTFSDLCGCCDLGLLPDPGDYLPPPLDLLLSPPPQILLLLPLHLLLLLPPSLLVLLAPP